MTKPIIVTLCGSTRFYREFQRANYEETMLGKIVLSVGFYSQSSVEAHSDQLDCTPDQKKMLDELHLYKIDMSDEVLIINVGKYIGESTQNELNYAIRKNKKIRYLESLGENLYVPSIQDDKIMGNNQ